jgi:hypothetical protein
MVVAAAAANMTKLNMVLFILFNTYLLCLRIDCINLVQEIIHYLEIYLITKFGKFHLLLFSGDTSSLNFQTYFVILSNIRF